MDYKRLSRRNKNQAEQFVKKIEEEYKKKQEDEKIKNAEQIAATQVIELVQKNPHIAQEILKQIVRKEEIPNEVFEKAATEITKLDEIPDTVVSEVVRDDNLEIPDRIIANIIEKGEMNQPETIVLINNLEDDKIKKDKIIQKLEEFYKNCSEMSEIELVEKITDLNFIQKDKEMELLEQRIVAKKMATNYKTFGGTKIDILAQCVSEEKMLEINIPELVELEYKELNEDNEKNSIDKSKLKVQILERIARNVAKTYNEIGTLIIPQSKNMENITEEEENKFIKKLQVYLENGLEKSELNDVKKQIRGKSNNIKFINYIEKIKEKPQKESESFIRNTNELLDDKELMNVYEELINSNILNTLKEMPKEKRHRYIDIIDDVLAKEKYRKDEEKLQRDGDEEER